MERQQQKDGRAGSALVMALWTIALLSVLVMSFAFDALLEGRIGTYIRQRQRVNHLTQSGVAIAEMLLEKQRSVSPVSASDRQEDRWKEAALRIKRGQTSVVEEPIGEGIVRVEIIPEQARWNINKLCNSAQGAQNPAGAQPMQRAQTLQRTQGAAMTPNGQVDLVWEQIFRVAGVPEEYVEELMDCWNDWTDTDSTIAGRNGAEDDYYKELEVPYAARNGPIDTVDELRLVKAFKPAILDGGILNPEEPRPEQQIHVKGIKELFTIYGDGKINVNAAPMEVLMTIPGIDEIMAGAIIEEREGRGGTFSRAGRSADTRRSSASSSAARSGNGRSVASSSSGRSGGAASSGRTGDVKSGLSAGTDAEEEDYSFKTVGDFISRVPGLEASVEQYITVSSGTFRLNIEGQSAGISHRIEAIMELDGEKLRYLRWREDP